ncbi:MAG: hypothetical protein ACFCUR_00945 [Rhodomicrobiaceae bacterium]
MGVIKTLLGIVILLAIIVFGYWLYATYTIGSADDEIWIKVNSNLPAPLREWSCAEVNSRVLDAEAPEGCGGFWQAAETVEPAPAAGSIPSAESVVTESPAETAPDANGTTPPANN